MSCCHPSRLESLSFPWGKSSLLDLCCWSSSVWSRIVPCLAPAAPAITFHVCFSYYSIFNKPLLRQMTGSSLPPNPPLRRCCVDMEFSAGLFRLFVCFRFLVSWTLDFRSWAGPPLEHRHFCVVLLKTLCFFLLPVSLLTVASGCWALEWVSTTGRRCSFSYFSTWTLDHKPQRPSPRRTAFSFIPTNGAASAGGDLLFSHTITLIFWIVYRYKVSMVFFPILRAWSKKDSPKLPNQGNHFLLISLTYSIYCPNMCPIIDCVMYI